MMKKTYFLSDAHLGSWAIPNGRAQERRVVRFLDSIKDDAAAIYMLGDMFDFWHEYKYVVPKGYTRLLGKLSELVDNGVEVHFFAGNHDLWCGDYLEQECGVILHREQLRVKLGTKQFFVAHGDGLDKNEKHYLFLRSIFHNRLCQCLFASIHPRWGVWFGYEWARRSRLKHERMEGIMQEPTKDGLYHYCLEKLKKDPDIDYFIFGHRHVDVDMALNNQSRYIILGDWVTKFTYAEFDGDSLKIKHFDET